MYLEYKRSKGWGQAKTRRVFGGEQARLRWNAYNCLKKIGFFGLRGAGRGPGKFAGLKAPDEFMDQIFIPFPTGGRPSGEEKSY